MLKQIMIPVAAFAITATSASAFTSTTPFENLDLNLTEAQTAALEEAHEIRTTSREEAAQILEDAGIDKAMLKEIHGAMHEARHEHREEVKTAIANNDFEAFEAATGDSPFAETIDTEAEFAQLVEAHNLHEAGDIEGAKDILEELGLPTPGEQDGKGFHGHHNRLRN